MTKITTTLNKDRVASCRGAHHKDWANIATCDNCGATVTVSSKGHVTDFGGYYTCWSPSHVCKSHDISLMQRFNTKALAAGEIVKFAVVEVFKGRKVPVGTVGTVVWTGTDSYDNKRVGIKDEDGNMHYTAESNVRLVASVQEAAQAELAKIDVAHEQAEAEARRAVIAECLSLFANVPSVDAYEFANEQAQIRGSWQALAKELCRND